MHQCYVPVHKHTSKSSHNAKELEVFEHFKIVRPRAMRTSIGIAVTQAEREAAAELAALGGVSVTTMMRNMLLDVLTKSRKQRARLIKDQAAKADARYLELFVPTDLPDDQLPPAEVEAASREPYPLR